MGRGYSENSFSTTLTSAEWNNTTLIKDNITEEVNNLKQQPGKDLVIFGSPGLAKNLMHLGLIDEFRLTLHPVLLGKGISLFHGNTQMRNLKLLESKTLGSGVVTLHYTMRCNDTYYSFSIGLNLHPLYASEACKLRLRQ